MIIAVVVLAVAALLGLVFYIGSNHVRRIAALKEKKSQIESEHMPKHRPYFQPKAELDVETKGNNELEARDLKYELGPGERYEIEGDGGRAEMTEANTENGPLPSLMERHELRGDEHSRELEGHDI